MRHADHSLDQIAHQLGLGRVEKCLQQRISWGFNAAMIPGGAVVLGLFGLLGGGDLLLVGAGGALLGALLGAAMTVMQAVALRRRIRVRHHEHGLVAVDRGVVVAGRWNELRLLSWEWPRGTTRWRVSSPGGSIEVSDNAWAHVDDAFTPALRAREQQVERARRQIAAGGTWDFSGWELSAAGIRTAATALPWHAVRLRAGRDMKLTGMIDHLELRDPAGRIIDRMEIDDGRVLAEIAAPWLQPAGAAAR